MPSKSPASASQLALKFIVLMGVVSLFADMAYEGARSVTGAYLATLGASAALVSFIAGLGEFVGYGLRWLSGYIADRSRQYWMITFIGYSINLLAIPALALTQHWPAAAALIVAERLGKAIRLPTRDAMLADASEHIGMGWGFGLHQALDQVGAMLGPLLIALVLYLKGSYQQGFALLAAPAVIALLVLAIAYRLYSNPESLVIKQLEVHTQGLNPSFWWYVVAIACVGLGFANFPLIAYHFKKTELLAEALIPISYGAAMGVNALLAPLMGRLYDQWGISVLIVVTILSAFFAPLVFLGNEAMAFAGVILWGVGVSAQASLMRAIVGNMISAQKRASAYGVFNMIYGLAWFVGSILLGFLYDYSIREMVVFSWAAQLSSVPWLFVVKRKLKQLR